MCSFCSNRKEEISEISLLDLADKSEGINGETDYLQSPFITAGDRIYMVGHQDGSFPDLGWHIDGEMGGIWDHPIKLMDGFSILLINEEIHWSLDSATSFQNLPFGNIHQFGNKDFKIERFQFVPEGIEGLIVELSIENKSSQQRAFNLVFTGHVDLRPTWLSEREHIEDGVDIGVYDEKLNAIVSEDTNNPWSVVFGGRSGCCTY